MNNRERILAILNYQNYDRVPILHFGFWDTLLPKWVEEGHLTKEELDNYGGDGSVGEEIINQKLGFDGNYSRNFSPDLMIRPVFETKVLETLPNGTRKVQNAFGAVLLDSDSNESIPAEVDHSLKERPDWDDNFKARFAFDKTRVDDAWVNVDGTLMQFGKGGKELLATAQRQNHNLLFCGSFYGNVRSYIGIENMCYMLADDPDLFLEIINTNADLCYECTRYALESGGKFDLGHFWEDICFKNGPLVNPDFFYKNIGPLYKRTAELLSKHGIDLISLDCDGKIDALIPTWLDNGVNIMFPIEVGTWNASIEPWREKYGKAIRGVGGMRKHVFAADYAAVDEEVERLKRLVDLGGFIPCPDHRLPDDTKWENVQYYCEKMRKAFSS